MDTKKALKAFMAMVTICFTAHCQMGYRGIVYDVGLQYNPNVYSVDTLNIDVVKYDMQVISDILRCNTIRIEGEDINRLVSATEIAHEHGLKVFFNPWLMESSVDSVISYMGKAAQAAQELKNKGVDLTFVAGCEFSLFNKGVLEGSSLNERMFSLMKLGEYADEPEKITAFMTDFSKRLNDVLYSIVTVVRENFTGDVTYSSGTWEPVDWSIFDAVGVDYYRDKQSDEEYIEGIQKYLSYGKPVWVMEVGCCTYEGAALQGGSGFTICTGVDEDGNGIYMGGQAPRRSEKEQADYIERQIRILNDSGIEGMFIFEFSFPIAPYRETGQDADLTAYPIVKSFPKDNPRSRQVPPWEPKEAFYRLGDIYHQLEIAIQ